MNTKLLASATLALAIGCTSWSAGAATDYLDAAPGVKTSPGNASRKEAEKPAPSVSATAMYVTRPSGEYAPNAVARPAPAERAFKSGIGPAMMFQLRDNAGG